MTIKCPTCGGLDSHSPWCGDNPDQQTEEMLQLPKAALPPREIALVALSDGSTYQVLLGNMPWDAFMYELLTKSCVMTGDIFINRSSIAHVRRMYLPPEAVVSEGQNVVIFPPTKGSA